jgi:hypothetical protein
MEDQKKASSSRIQLNEWAMFHINLQNRNVYEIRNVWGKQKSEMFEENRNGNQKCLG